jgi:hypothetical protein
MEEMAFLITIMILFTLALLCGKLMGFSGFIGSIIGSMIALLYIYSNYNL